MLQDNLSKLRNLFVSLWTSTLVKGVIDLLNNLKRSKRINLMGCRWTKLLYDEDRVHCPHHIDERTKEEAAQWCYYCHIPEIYKCELGKGEGGEHALFTR